MNKINMNKINTLINKNFYLCSMEKEVKKIESNKEKDFIKEYEELMISTSNNSVIVRTEWTKDGDFFEKLSMYDNSYVPVKTLGSTTLIKAL
jgi:hypothetical protein